MTYRSSIHFLTLCLIGRINVAHAHKKKRLDGEFERLLSQIESKRDVLQVTRT